jgi:hypothetical protein
MHISVKLSTKLSFVARNSDRFGEDYPVKTKASRCEAAAIGCRCKCSNALSRAILINQKFNSNLTSS